MKSKYLILILLVQGCSSAPVKQNNLLVRRARDSAAEQKTQADLVSVTQKFPLASYYFSDHVVIADNSVAEVQPNEILVATASDRDEMTLLKEFLAQESLFFLGAREQDLSRAAQTLRELYPNLPLGEPLAAKTETENYLLLMRDSLAYRALKPLVGDAEAAKLMRDDLRNRALHKLVLNNEAQILHVMQEHHLLPDE